MRNMVLRTAAVLVALLACLAVPMRAYASEQTVEPSTRVRMFQEYKVSTSGLQTSFDYRIVAQEPGAPLPAGADGGPMGGFTLTRDEDLWLTFAVPVAALPEDHRATYHYLLEPVTDALPDGLYYVDVLSTSLSRGANRYYLTINVAPATEGSSDVIVVPNVHIEGWDGPKVTDPGWRIAYEEPKEDKSDKSDDPAPNGFSSSATKEPANTANAARPATEAGASASRQTTAKTKDPTRVLPAAIGLVCVLLGVAYRLRKAGEDHA